MKHILSALMLLGLVAQSAWAQSFAIKGKLLDKTSGEPLIGAGVQVTNGDVVKGAQTEVNGSYKIENIAPGTYQVTATYIGYDPVTEKVVVTDKDAVVTFRLAENNATFTEVEIVADVAVERETPIAFSAIKETTIRESLAGRDLPLILNETPGVYANAAGGGTGDSEVSIRGFSQNNVAVMVNGVPVNDMENGQVFWSNWDLGDVTKSVQVQRGLSASKLATPSVGGTLNILTRGFDNKRSVIARQELGSNNYSKTSLMLASGKLKGDWSVTVFGSRRRGDGWVQGTFDDSWSYFGNISKKFGNHTLSLTGLGSPQTHGQRSFHGGIYKVREFSAEKALEIGAAVEKNADGTYKDNYGYDYNADYGQIDRYTVQDRDTTHHRENYNSQQNFYHKPQINLNHFWSISDKLFMSNVVYASVGNGGGQFIAGVSIPSKDGHTDFQKIYDTNFSKGLSTVVARNSINNHRWYGFISGLDYRANENTTISIGVDGRSYKGEHYAEVDDLLGGTYTTMSATGTGLNGNLNQDRLAKLYKGDKFGNIYDGFVRSIGGFAMAEYKTTVLSAFLSGTVSQTYYKRINYSQAKLFNINGADYSVGFVNQLTNSNNPIGTKVDNVYYTQSPYFISGKDTVNLNPNSPTLYKGANYQQATNGRFAESDPIRKIGYSIKGGLNYNINEFNNIFFNAGYISRPPFIDFIFSRTTGAVIPNAKNEGVASFEVGYGINRSSFKANLNAYYTLWFDKSTTLTLPDPETQADVTFNASGMDARHTGVELEIGQQISRKLELNAAISLGDWRWTSNGEARGFDEFGNELPVVKFNADGIHVGGSAQNQFMVGLRYEPIERFYIRPTFLLFSKHYASFDPKDLIGKKPQDSYRLPSSRNIDVHTGYSFNFYKDLKLNLNGSVLNLLDEFYIIKVNPSSNPSDPNTLLAFFNKGRTFVVGASVSF